MVCANMELPDVFILNGYARLKYILHMCATTTTAYETTSTADQINLIKFIATFIKIFANYACQSYRDLFFELRIY